jgi:hypothetical protein
MGDSFALFAECLFKVKLVAVVEDLDGFLG